MLRYNHARNALEAVNIYDHVRKTLGKKGVLVYRGGGTSAAKSESEEKYVAVEIRKAKRSLAKIKLGIAGASGSGKTLGSLLTGFG